MIELARVGSHNNGADWRDVQSILERAATPFDVVFADEAGLEARFRTPIDAGHARSLAEDVLEREWVDSICVMAEEMEGKDDGDPLARVVAYIVTHNAVRLWWD